MLRNWIILLCVAVPLAGTPAAGQQENQNDPAAPTPAEGSTNEESPSPTPAEQALRAAEEQLGRYEWIRAQLVQEVELYGKKFRATGQHLEGPEYRLRRELRVKLDDQTSSLLEVCDGQAFWRRQEIEQTVGIERVQIDSVLEVLGATGQGDRQDLFLQMMGLTQLQHLVGGLLRNFRFEGLSQGDWRGKPVNVVRGVWRREVLQQYMPGQFEIDDDAPADEQSDEEKELLVLPRHIPDEVVVFVSREDGVPYRLEFRKQRPGREPTTLATLELTDVALDQPIDDQEFFFVPPSETQVNDITQQIVLQIRLSAQQGGQGGPQGLPGLGPAPPSVPPQQ